MVGYKGGWWGTEDPKEAFFWYKKSAEQGEDGAQLQVGECYANGYGVKMDLRKAASWYQKAADQGNEEAKTRLKELNQKGLTEELVRSLVKKYNLERKYQTKLSPEFNKNTKKAVSTYASSAKVEDILLMEDRSVSMFKKEGFVLTAKNIYYNFSLFGKGQFPLEKIISVSTEHSSESDLYRVYLNVKHHVPNYDKLYKQCLEVLKEETGKESTLVEISYSFDKSEAVRIEKFWNEILKLI